MTENNDIVIKKLVFKITQDNNFKSKKIFKDFSLFIKRQLESAFQKTIQKKFNQYKFQDINIEKLSFDIDDISENGNFSEQKFLNSFALKFEDSVDHNFILKNENFNLSQKYDNVISCFETLCKKKLDEKKSKIFFENFEELLDKKPELLQEHFNVVLKNKFFFDNFFETVPERTFTKVFSFLRRTESTHFSKVFELYNDKIFSSSNNSQKQKPISVNPSLQHLNLNARQVNFIRRELKKNKNLDAILQNDFYFTAEQSDAIKENIVEKDFGFILRKILKLQDYEIDLIEKNVKNRNLNFVLKNEIKLNDKQIELV